MEARSACEWSSEAAARAMCPNSLRRCCCISEETGDGWFVTLYRYVSNVCTVQYMGCGEYGVSTIDQKQLTQKKKIAPWGRPMTWGTAEP